MNNRLLKEYVTNVLREEFYFVNPLTLHKKKKKKKGILHHVKDFFSGPVSNLAEDWIDNAEFNFGIEIDEKFRKEVEKFIEKKKDRAYEKSNGDREKAAELLKRALDSRYYRKLRDLAREDLDDDEEKH